MFKWLGISRHSNSLHLSLSPSIHSKLFGNINITVEWMLVVDVIQNGRNLLEALAFTSEKKYLQLLWIHRIRMNSSSGLVQFEWIYKLWYIASRPTVENLIHGIQWITTVGRVVLTRLRLHFKFSFDLIWRIVSIAFAVALLATCTQVCDHQVHTYILFMHRSSQPAQTMSACTSKYCRRRTNFMRFVSTKKIKKMRLETMTAIQLPSYFAGCCMEMEMEICIFRSTESGDSFAKQQNCLWVCACNIIPEISNLWKFVRHCNH